MGTGITIIMIYKLHLGESFLPNFLEPSVPKAVLRGSERLGLVRDPVAWGSAELNLERKIQRKTF